MKKPDANALLIVAGLGLAAYLVSRAKGAVTAVSAAADHVSSSIADTFFDLINGPMADGYGTSTPQDITAPAPAADQVVPASQSALVNRGAVRYAALVWKVMPGGVYSSAIPLAQANELVDIGGWKWGANPVTGVADRVFSP